MTVSDPLPVGLSLVSATVSQGSYLGGVWTVGTVDLSTVPTLAVTALVISPDPETNTATISHSDQFDPDTSNNTASATETPEHADLALVKTVDNPTPNVGNIVIFTVALTNFGPNTATDVSVADALPPGLTLVSAMPSQGTYANGIWTVGTVNAGATPTLTLDATVVSPSAETNTAAISHSDQFDPNPGNNTTSATVTPQQADLALTKTVSNPMPNVGDTVTFTVALTNLGPDAATNVSVADTLPAGLTLVSATPSQGSYVSGVWIVGTVSPSAAPTLIIMALVVSPNAETNTATISHSDQFDSDTSNNSQSATVTPQRADVSVIKTANTQLVVFGMTLTYTFVVHNSGPSAADNVVVTDLFPNPGLAFVSAVPPSQGTFTFNPSNFQGAWFVGTLANGAAATLQIVAQVTSTGPIVNTASVSTSTFDSDLSNNASSASIIGMQAPGSISKRDFLSSSDPPAFPAPSVGWHDVLTRDFTGDGRQDIAGRTASGQWWVSVSNATGVTSQLWTTWTESAGWHDVQVGDFNSDGKADIAGRTSGGDWWVAISTGSSFINQFWGHWNPNVTWVDVKVGDFTGDGKDDIVGRYLQGGQWYVAQSTGSSFTNRLWASWNPNVTWVDVKVGDLNGDGKADITGRWLQGGSWWTGISAGSAFTTSMWTVWSTAATWVDVQVGDFNGDGKADLTGRWLQGGQWWTAISTGSSFVNSLWDTWNPGVTWVDVKVADFNGDGRADLIGRVLQSGQWWMAESTGSSFSNSLWDTWSTAVSWVDVGVGNFGGGGMPDLVGRVLQNGQWWAAMPNGASVSNQLWTTWAM